MKTLFGFLICVLLCCQVSHAQSGKLKTQKDFSIGLSFEANYSYRMLNYTNQNRMMERERNAGEVGRMGIETGIIFRHQLRKKIALSYGADYARFGYNTKYTDLNFVSPGETYPVRGRTEYLYQSIGIPVTMEYALGTSKFNPYLMGGLSGNFILRKTITTQVEYADGRTENASHVPTLGYQRFNLSALLGLGVKFKTQNERFTIAAESIVRSSLTSFSPDVNSKEKPYTLGLAIKTFYTFRRK